MTISPLMNLEELSQRMGQLCTHQDAVRMRVILTDSPYSDTLEVPDRVWSEMVLGAVNNDHPSLQSR